MLNENKTKPCIIITTAEETTGSTPQVSSTASMVMISDTLAMCNAARCNTVNCLEKWYFPLVQFQYWDRHVRELKMVCRLMAMFYIYIMQNLYEHLTESCYHLNLYQTNHR